MPQATKFPKESRSFSDDSDLYHIKMVLKIKTFEVDTFSFVALMIEDVISQDFLAYPLPIFYFFY